MEEKSLKRVYAGYYTRWDKKRIYVVRVVKDIDTGEEIVICKDASFSKKTTKITTRSPKPPSASRSRSMVSCRTNTFASPAKK